MFALAIVAGVMLSLMIGAGWWCLQDCSQIGWLMILGPFVAAAAVFAYGIAFILADQAGRWLSTGLQILLCGFLPGLLIFLYYVPFKFHELGYDHGSRSAAWAFWHVFGPVILGGLATIPGGLVGGILIFVLSEDSQTARRYRKNRASPGGG